MFAVAKVAFLSLGALSLSAALTCPTGQFLSTAGTACVACSANCAQFSALAQCPASGTFTFSDVLGGATFDGATGPGAGCVLCDP